MPSANFGIAGNDQLSLKAMDRQEGRAASANFTLIRLRRYQTAKIHYLMKPSGGMIFALNNHDNCSAR